MADYPMRGNLRFRAQTVREDAAYVRNHLGELSEPEERAITGAAYQWATFGATVEQWQTLEPELAKRGIMAYLSEELTTIARADANEQRYGKFLARKNQRQLISAAGGIISIAGVFCFFSSTLPTTIACVIIGAGMVLTALGRVMVGASIEQYHNG